MRLKDERNAARFKVPNNDISGFETRGKQRPTMVKRQLARLPVLERRLGHQPIQVIRLRG